MKNKEEILTLIDRLESIVSQALIDQKNKNWGTYDTLIDEYNKIKSGLASFQDELPWIANLPLIDTVPSKARGGFIAGGPPITGMGTAAEKAKYSEITTKIKPVLNRLKKNVSGTEKQNDHTDSNKYTAHKGKRRIFIVHGQDLASARRVKEFVSADLNMEPIVLMDEANIGRTIPEKFEQYASKSDYAIILMTPDDALQYDGSEGVIYRARQNVILELGYFWGEFDRSKFAVLKKGNIEAPSDILGVLYIPFTENVEETFYRLQREIEAAFREKGGHLL